MIFHCRPGIVFFSEFSTCYPFPLIDDPSVLQDNSLTEPFPLFKSVFPKNTKIILPERYLHSCKTYFHNWLRQHFPEKQENCVSFPDTFAESNSTSAYSLIRLNFQGSTTANVLSMDMFNVGGLIVDLSKNTYMNYVTNSKQTPKPVALLFCSDSRH